MADQIVAINGNKGLIMESQLTTDGLRVMVGKPLGCYHLVSQGEGPTVVATAFK